MQYMALVLLRDDGVYDECYNEHKRYNEPFRNFNFQHDKNDCGSRDDSEKRFPKP